MSAIELIPTNWTDSNIFLQTLAGDEILTFQTFDETPNKRKHLTRVLHGTFSEQANRLAELNEGGAGVFVMVNAGDGLGRKSSNVIRVRAFFVDLDGAEVEPLYKTELIPHFIIESSPGHFHGYWLVTDAPMDSFASMQKTLANHFGGDSKVSDLARVMRVPGFLHHKRQPFETRIEQLNEAKPYSYNDLARAFQHVEQPIKLCKKLPTMIPQGERNNALLSLAGGLHARGIPKSEALERIRKINSERCTPPLPADEVESVVEQAYSYQLTTFAAIPHSVLDSKEYKGLSHGARSLLLIAYRRYSGNNNGDISLTFAECNEHFKNKKCLKRCREELINSGLLIQTRSSMTGKAGSKRLCALYELKHIKGVRKTPM